MNSSTHSPTGVLSSLTLDDLSLRHSELAGQPPQSPCPRPRTLTASPESTPLFLKGVVSTDEDDGDLLSLRTSDEIRSISEPIEPVPDPKSIPECDQAPKSLQPSPNGGHEELRVADEEIFKTFDLLASTSPTPLEKVGTFDCAAALHKLLLPHPEVVLLDCRDGATGNFTIRGIAGKSQVAETGLNIYKRLSTAYRYVAISHVSPPPHVQPGPSEDIIIVKDVHGKTTAIDITVLKKLCDLALEKDCTWLWLEELCEFDTKHKEPLARARRMRDIFENAKKCFAMPYSLFAWARCQEPTYYLHNAWTWLQMASLMEPDRDLHIVMTGLPNLDGHDGLPVEGHDAHSEQVRAERPTPHLLFDLLRRAVEEFYRSPSTAEIRIFGELFQVRVSGTLSYPTLDGIRAAAALHAFSRVHSNYEGVHREQMKYKGVMLSRADRKEDIFLVLFRSCLSVHEKYLLQSAYLIRDMIQDTSSRLATESVVHPFSVHDECPVVHPFWLGVLHEVPAEQEFVLFPAPPVLPPTDSSRSSIWKAEFPRVYEKDWCDQSVLDIALDFPWRWSEILDFRVMVYLGHISRQRVTLKANLAVQVECVPGQPDTGARPVIFRTMSQDVSNAMDWPCFPSTPSAVPSLPNGCTWLVPLRLYEASNPNPSKALEAHNCRYILSGCVIREQNPAQKVRAGHPVTIWQLVGFVEKMVFEEDKDVFNAISWKTDKTFRLSLRADGPEAAAATGQPPASNTTVGMSSGPTVSRQRSQECIRNEQGEKRRPPVRQQSSDSGLPTAPPPQANPGRATPRRAYTLPQTRPAQQSRDPDSTSAGPSSSRPASEGRGQPIVPVRTASPSAGPSSPRPASASVLGRPTVPVRTASESPSSLYAQRTAPRGPGQRRPPQRAQTVGAVAPAPAPARPTSPPSSAHAHAQTQTRQYEIWQPQLTPEQLAEAERQARAPGRGPLYTRAQWRPPRQ